MGKSITATSSCRNWGSNLEVTVNSVSIEIPLLTIYFTKKKKTKQTTHRNVCLKIFLCIFLIAKHRKRSEYPSMVELLMELWYTQTVDKHDAIKGEGRYNHRTMSMKGEWGERKRNKYQKEPTVA